MLFNMCIEKGNDENEVTVKKQCVNTGRNDLSSFKRLIFFNFLATSKLVKIKFKRGREVDKNLPLEYST